MVALALVDDAQHFVLLQQVGVLLHHAAQTFPVFAPSLDVPEAAVQVGVSLGDIVCQCLGAAFGQCPVVGNGGFGRGIAGDIDAGDGEVCILAHQVDGGAHLVQLALVVLILGQDAVAVLAVL